MALQRVQIDVPALEPLPFGLTSVADVADATDPHLLNGFDYEQICGFNTGFAASACYDATATTTKNAGVSPWPATVTIVSDLPGSYTVDWGDATATDTVTITEPATSGTTGTHNYTTSTAKTITITGPLGYGVRTIAITPNVAATTSAARFSKSALPAYGTIVGQPVAVYARHECRPVGMDPAERQSRAMRALTTGESYALEKALKARHLLSTATDVTNGTATTPKRAIALLEHYAAKNYAGRPIIHLDRYTGSIASSDGLIDRHGNHLETKQGAYVASGAGYSATVDPIPATVEIYVTGMVRIRKGAAIVRDGGQPSNTNDVSTLAERIYVAAVECLVARALVATT